MFFHLHTDWLFSPKITDVAVMIETHRHLQKYLPTLGLDPCLARLRPSICCPQGSKALLSAGPLLWASSSRRPRGDCLQGVQMELGRRRQGQAPSVGKE